MEGLQGQRYKDLFNKQVKTKIKMRKNIDERLRIGQRLAGLRKEKGYTVRSLSEKCGITYQYLSKIENGKFSASIDVVSLICEALDAKIEIINQ